MSHAEVKALAIRKFEAGVASEKVMLPGQPLGYVRTLSKGEISGRRGRKNWTTNESGSPVVLRVFEQIEEEKLRNYFETERRNQAPSTSSFRALFPHAVHLHFSRINPMRFFAFHAKFYASVLLALVPF